MAAKILLVEDDNNLREIYEARLEAEGYDIVTARDGEEALVVAKNEKPDLIISDVMMPRISGFEMLDILRNTDELKATKVIMLTALGQAEDESRANNLGADRYLVKSQVTLEDIVKATHELVDNVTSSTAPTTLDSSIDQTPSPATPTQTAPPTNVTLSSTTPAPVSPPSEDNSLSNSPDQPLIPSPTQAAATSINVSVPDDSSTASTAVTSQNSPSAADQQALRRQIENFINHREISAPTTRQPQPTPTNIPASTIQDTVLTNAVNDLTVNMTPPAIPNPPVPKATLPPNTQPQPTPPPEEKKAESRNGSVVIANKKIIKPLDTGPKPSLNDLLAAEEAKEIMRKSPQRSLPETNQYASNAIDPSDLPSGGPAAPSPGSTFSPAQSTDNQTKSNNFDPNSIAL